MHIHIQNPMVFSNPLEIVQDADYIHFYFQQGKLADPSLSASLMKEKLPPAEQSSLDSVPVEHN